MARPIWTGTLSFGLLNVPVSLMSGELHTDLHFRMLDSRDRKPVRYERVNADTGEEVPWKDVVKAYEYDKGSYVVLEEEDIRAAAPESHETVEVETFVDAGEIDPRYYEKPYVLVPAKKAEKGYVLLRETLRGSNRVGIARVVIAAEDTSQAEGAGLARLRGAGIAVETGLMREPARELNVGFFRRIETRRPFVRVKLAMSLDGRTALANGESKWITGEAAREDVQRWRARSSAILSGSGTVLADDPRLTVRLPEDEEFTPPLRVLLDRQLRTPAGSHVLDGTAPTLVLHGAAASCADDRFARVERMAMATRDNLLDLQAVLALLAGRDCNEVHVEAGPTLCGALFAAGMADELLLYVAPLLLGDSARPLLQLPTLSDMASRWQLQPIEQRQLGHDWRLRLRPL